MFELPHHTLFIDQPLKFFASGWVDVNLAGNVLPAAYEFFRVRKTVHAGQRGIGRDILALWCGLKNPFAGVFKDVAILSFGFPEGVLCAPALSYVVHRAKHTRGISTLIDDYVASRVNESHGSVRTDYSTEEAARLPAFD